MWRAIPVQRQQCGRFNRARFALSAVPVVLALLVFGGRPLLAEDAYRAPSELKKLSVEELLDVDVTSVSKYPEKLSAAAAAVSVLTQEDIHRAGVTNIPDALRLVPGLDVAQVDAHSWAISSRGFNDVFANKLLVTIDGRTVYTPLFSGVFWDVQNTLLEDIDRIEVVRGPGATLWGANAVNGVISIITKSAREAQGLLLSGGGGIEDRGLFNIRYGVKLEENAYLKVYGQYFNHDSSVLPTNDPAHDAWDMYHGGFRFDWDPMPENSMTLQGDIYAGHENQIYAVPLPTPPFAGRTASTDDVSGGNLLGRWSHRFAPDSELTIQGYYDRTVRNTPVLSENRDTGDIDLQHRFALGDRQEVVWGLGFRITHDDVRNTLNVSLHPDNRTLALYSAFVQDEISIVSDRLRLTLGSKFEHNDFTGFEVQPSARAAWTPGYSQTIWGAISRAVRTPSQAESDVRLNPAPPFPLPPGSITILGNPNMLAEELIAYEMGYRIQPVNQLKIDLTAFYNSYDHLRSVEPLAPGPISPTRIANKFFGETYGAEIAVTAQICKRWRVQGSYSNLEIQLHRKSGSRDASTERVVEGSSPQNQFSISSLLDLGWNIQFDSTLRYVDALPAPQIPSYVTVDLRLAWSPRPNLEVAIVGRNLLDDRHPEFSPTSIGTQQTEVERNVYATIIWHY